MNGQICIARKTNGEPCRAYALSKSEYCFMHDPSKREERKAARKLGGYNRRSAAASDWSKRPKKVRTLKDVLRVLDLALGDLANLENSLGRVRAIISLAGAYTETIKQSEFERRLDDLEEQFDLVKWKQVAGRNTKQMEKVEEEESDGQV